MPLGNSHRVPGGANSTHLATACRGAAGDRREPLLVALAADHQERLAGPDRAARQADQLARPKPRAVEQFEQGEIAHRPRLPARGAVLGGGEHPLDLGLVEDPRQAAARAAGAAGGGGIVLAQPIVDQEAEEAAQRGGAPGDGRRARDPPSARRDSPDRALLACAERGQRLRRALEIVAIGRERVPRGPGLGGEHVEEAVDQRAVVRAHVRASASAAIIRAV